MSKLRLGIVGLGNIGKFHAGYLLEGKIARCELAAVSDTHTPNLEPFAAKGVATFEKCEDMIRSGKIDAIVVATPHFLHTTLGIEALRAGLHTMIEKPISAHKADAERLCAVAREHPRQVFAGMFQLRVEPRYLEIRRILAEEIGRLVRVNWIITDWFRTEAYYASGGWRATW
jgi:predicted dehydrogenase